MRRLCLFCRSLLRVLALLLVVSSVGPGTPALAQPETRADICEPLQSPAFEFGVAGLRAHLGDAVGTPTGCLQENPENGDVSQETTTGLAFYRASTGTPTFTNGHDHWALVGTRLVHWIGESIDPPASADEPPGPPPAVAAPRSLRTVGRPPAAALAPAPPPPSAAAPAPVPPRPSAAAPTPPTIDAALMPAWSTLTSIDRVGPDGRSFGASFREVLETTGVRVVVGELRDAWAAYRVPDNTVSVSRDALGEDPRALAAVLAHEITHARQVASGHGRKVDCVGMEVEAHAAEAIIWGSFWGGRGPARTRLERELNGVFDILTAEGEPGLYKHVVDGQGYQGQCRLWVP